MIDDALIDAIHARGDGRLRFDAATDTLLHTRTSGGRTPIHVSCAEVRSLMALLVLREEEPFEGTPLARGVGLLLDLLDRHPVRALLGWGHVHEAARNPAMATDVEHLWGDTA